MRNRIIRTIRAFGLLVALGANGYAAGDSSVLAAVPPPAYLLCERAENPVIDVVVPALSWKLTDTRSGAAQTAYRILVASSLEQLASDRGDLWDSGRVGSDQSLDVAYAGQPLSSRQQAFWKVKVWDQDGQESPWSEPASWRMALLDAQEWQARWIAAPAMTEPQSEGLDVFLDAASMSEASKSLFRGRQPELLFRRTFHVPQEGAADAIVRVCGLGAFNLFINGQKIGDGWLDPISSDYREVAYYKTFDITQYLRWRTAGMARGLSGWDILSSDLRNFWPRLSGWITRGRCMPSGRKPGGRSASGRPCVRIFMPGK